jgi:hypothetical protein
MRNTQGGLKRNLALRRSAVLLPLLVTIVCVRAFPGDAEPDSEAKSFLPLIPESTYSYSFTYKERKGTETLVVKSAKQAGVELFYFIRENESNNPQALLASTSLGLGVYVKQEGGIATLECYDKSTLNRLVPKIPTLILKVRPEAGQSFTVAHGDLKHTYRVEGREDVVVAAGTFKDCLKLKLEEIEKRAPPAPDVTRTGFVWLAQGVGVVKWQRVTGRVDELNAYKLAPMPKAEKQ